MPTKKSTPTPSAKKFKVINQSGKTNPHVLQYVQKEIQKAYKEVEQIEQTL